MVREPENLHQTGSKEQRHRKQPQKSLSMLPTREISCKNQDLEFCDGEGSSKSFAASRTRMFSLMFFFLFALAPAKVQLRATGSSEPVTGERSPGPGRSPRPAAPAGARLHAAPLRATFGLAGGAASCPQHPAAACRSGPGAARGRAGSPPEERCRRAELPRPRPPAPPRPGRGYPHFLEVSTSSPRRWAAKIAWGRKGANVSAALPGAAPSAAPGPGHGLARASAAELARASATPGPSLRAARRRESHADLLGLGLGRARALLAQHRDRVPVALRHGPAPAPPAARLCPGPRPPLRGA